MRKRVWRMAELYDFCSSRTIDWWAAHLTAIWVGSIFVVICARYKEFVTLDLNALGDFFAGAFGPVAFGWLVLGYIQQGKELKLSSQALRVQADELREMVKGQRQLIEVSEIPFEPSFNIGFVGYREVDGSRRASYIMSNSGPRALDVTIYFMSEAFKSMGISYGELVTGREVEASFEHHHANTLGGVVQIKYRRASQREGCQTFMISPAAGLCRRLFDFPEDPPPTQA